MKRAIELEDSAYSTKKKNVCICGTTICVILHFFEPENDGKNCN